MEITAKTRHVRLAPSKAADLAGALRGLAVPAALRAVQFSDRKAAFYLAKTLKSAIANAANNHDLAVEKLYVKEAVVEQGAMQQRFWPRSRGMVSPVLKRTSHVRVTLTDQRPAAP